MFRENSITRFDRKHAPTVSRLASTASARSAESPQPLSAVCSSVRLTKNTAAYRGRKIADINMVLYGFHTESTKYIFAEPSVLGWV